MMLAAVALTGLTGLAAAAALPQNKHVADFRLFGAPGCAAQNLGIWTVIDTDFAPNECKSLGSDAVGAVTLVDINDGCRLSVFTDAACSAGRQTVGLRQCASAPEGLKAWSMECA